MTHRILTPDGFTTDPATIANNLVMRAVEATGDGTTLVPIIVIYDEQGPGENGIGNDGIWLNPDQAEAIGQRLLILAQAARDSEQWIASLQHPDAG